MLVLLQKASTSKLFCLWSDGFGIFIVFAGSLTAAISPISRSSAAIPNLKSISLWSLLIRRFSKPCVQAVPRLEAGLQMVFHMSLYELILSASGIRDKYNWLDTRWTASHWTDDGLLLLRHLFGLTRGQCYNSIPSHYACRNVCPCRQIRCSRTLPTSHYQFWKDPRHSSESCRLSPMRWYHLWINTGLEHRTPRSYRCPCSEQILQ